MTYQFQPSQNPARECCRIYRDLLNHAVERLRAYPQHDPEGLHEARKDLKKTRSLLRLLRKTPYAPLRKDLNAALRQLGQRLSPARDREVLHGMSAALARRKPVRGQAELKHGARKLEAFYAREGAGKPFLASETRAEVLWRLESLSRQFIPADLEGLTLEHLREGLRRHGLRMEKAFQRYQDNPGSHTLHEWRKRTKDHRYHLQLGARFPGVTRTRHKRVESLEKALGQARDCDLLLDRLRNRNDIGLEPEEIATLIIHLEQKKETLVARAVRLARTALAPVSDRRSRKASAG